MLKEMLKEVTWDDGNYTRWKLGSNKGGKNPGNGIFGVQYKTFVNFIKDNKLFKAKLIPLFCGVTSICSCRYIKNSKKSKDENSFTLYTKWYINSS